MMAQKEIMNTQEIADYIGVCPSKIRQWIREKRIPYIRLDGRILFLRTEIIKWLQSKQVAVNNIDLSEKLSKDLLSRLRKAS